MITLNMTTMMMMIYADLEEVNFQEQASNCRTLLSAGDPFAGFANKEGGQFPILNFLLK